MRPIPVVFHLGALQIHTYGIGLAITFWFAYRYFDRRLSKAGYPTKWLGATFVWVVVAAVVGARVVHVAAHLSYYSHYPVEVLTVWHGGLSSFGGLLFAVPTGIFLARRWCPELSIGRAVDLVTPVLVAAWGVGRLLGPQLMVAGGGLPTNAWYGMYYADQVGKRIPTPIFQAIDCFVIFGILLLVEKRYQDRRTGFVAALGIGLWGIARFFEEYLYLAVPRVWDAVEATGILLAVVGLSTAAWLALHRRGQVADAASGQEKPFPERAEVPRAAGTTAGLADAPGPGPLGTRGDEAPATT